MLNSLFSLFYVTGEFHRFLHRGRAEDCRGEFQKKIFNEAEEIASLNMGATNQYFSIDFLGGFIERISSIFIANVREFYTCFWLRGKLVEYPRLLIIYPRSLNNF